MENKWCFVPGCKNTSKNSPGKIFVTVPRQKQRKINWFNAVRRALPSTSTVFYSCQDHFKFEEDMENYIRYKLMGGPVMLKKEVVPHIFSCQLDSEEAVSSQELAVKRVRESIMEEIKRGKQTITPTKTKSVNNSAFDIRVVTHSVSFVQPSSTFECQEYPDRKKFKCNVADELTILKKNEIPTDNELTHLEKMSLSTDNSATLKVKECTQQNKLNKPENIGQIYINNSIETSTAEDTSCESQNDREIMELEIARLEESIIETRFKYCTSRKKIGKMKKILTKHLCTEVTEENYSVKTLEYEEMIKNLKIRFALGKQGYHDVKCIYPLPSSSVLCTMVYTIDIEFGISSDLIPALQAKFSVMEKWDTDCILCIAETPMKTKPWYDPQKRKHYGYTTLGDLGKPGTRLMFFLLRGLNSDWKQIISVDVTINSLKGDDVLKRINDVIEVARTANLNIRGIVSDMGTGTKSMWKSLGVQVSNHNQKTFYERDNFKVHVFADAQLLLSYLRQALLTDIFVLNRTVADNENLPMGIIIPPIINGSDVLKLWQKHSSCLSHLQHCDVFNGKLEKPVDAAIRFFDNDTAVGLESAVRTKKFENHNALTTAWFIKLVYKWISVLDSWNATKSITKENVEETLEFLTNFIFVIRDLELNVKGWEKLHTGLILSTTSFINLAREVFNEGYPCLLGNRLSQSILENVLYEFKMNLEKDIAVNHLAIIKSMILSQLMSD